MSTTIHKYTLKADSAGTEVGVAANKGARIVSCGAEKMEPVIWIAADPAFPNAVLHLMLVRTGEPAPDGARFVGTVQFDRKLVTKRMQSAASSVPSAPDSTWDEIYELHVYELTER